MRPSSSDPADTAALARLLGKWRLWLGAGLVSTAGLVAAWRRLSPDTDASVPVLTLRLLIPIGLVVLEMVLIRRRLHLNHAPDGGAIYPSFGAANTITMIRGLFVAWLAALLLASGDSASNRWIAVGLYTAAILADYADGFVARRTGRSTSLGMDLEGELDSLGVLVASCLIVAWASMPAWFVFVGLASYLFRLGMWLRRRRGMDLRVLRHSGSGRAVAGFQMGFMSAALWPIINQGFVRAGGILFSLFFFASFLRDWLVVSCVLDPDSNRYLGWLRRLRLFFLDLLPLFLRLVMPPVAYLSLSGGPIPVTIAGVVCAALTTLGVAGRWSALVYVGILVFSISGQNPESLQIAALYVALLAVILGTGRWSLWEPERRVFAKG